MLSRKEKIVKRIFDLWLSLTLLFFLLIPIVVLALIAMIQTKESGFYKQERIGRYGKKFFLLKIRTIPGTKNLGIKEVIDQESKFSRFLRKSKLNELPQLINILMGDMGFVGPRPDVSGFADKLEGEDSIVLSVLPGLTGPATLKYKKEDKLLLNQKDPDTYNSTVIWPDKVRINREYIQNWSFKKDIYYLYKTIFN